MNDEFVVECTNVDATGAKFTVRSHRSGTATATVGSNPGDNVSLTVSLNSQPTVKVAITQGTHPQRMFVVGDKFTFTTRFNYDEYRGSLAAPGCVPLLDAVIGMSLIDTHFFLTFSSFAVVCECELVSPRTDGNGETAIPIPRYNVAAEGEVKTYHCIARYVRRAYLCGNDEVSGKTTITARD